MKFRNTLILFGVVLVLFLLVYIFEIRRPEESTEKSKNIGKMLLVENEDVSKLELVYADPNYEKIVCFKDDTGQWQIEQPLKAKADQKIMNRVISNAMSKNIHNTLKEPGILSEYGLDNPRVTATFHLRDGTLRILMLGDTIPTGNYAYIKQKTIPDISLVPASIVDDLTKFVSDLRDRTVIALKKPDVQKIQLKYAKIPPSPPLRKGGTDSYDPLRKGGADRYDPLQKGGTDGYDTIICEKSPLEGDIKGGVGWNLVEPVAAKADTNEVEKIISDLNDLKVSRFVAEAPDDLSVYGLSQPQIEVTVSLKDGKVKTLLIGKKENDSVYAKRSQVRRDSQSTNADGPVFLVNAEIIDKLTKQPSDLRDRTVIAFDREAVEKLELKYPERSIVCERKSGEEGEIWEMTASDVRRDSQSTNADVRRDSQSTKSTEAKADESQIDEILRKLYDLKVDRFVSDKPKDLTMYGLTQPQIRAIVSPKGSGPETLLVGKKSGESVYVKTASLESVYLVDAAIVDDLSKETLDLRDRQVMKFERDDVKRIELKRKDKTIVCIKQERDWRIVEPVREKAKNYEVNDILSKLDDLRPGKLVAEAAAGAARLPEYGLDQPDVQVTVIFKDDSKETLLVGKNLPDSDSAYAKIAAGDVIFVIEKDVLDELKKDVDELLDT